MAKKKKEVREDSKGRQLKRGEYVRQSDGRLVYSYTDPLGRRKFIYANTLPELREKEKTLMKDQLDGLDVYARGLATLNTTFDRYIATKSNLRDTTRRGYIYTYDHFVRDTFGLKKIADIKYSDVLQFYLYLLEEEEIAMGTLDSVHCVIHPAFQLAVRDDILRKNPSDGVIAEVAKKAGKHRGTRHALTSKEQKTFMEYVANHPIFCHWWPIFATLLGTGMRIGECVGLRFEDVHIDKKYISVNHSAIYYPVKGEKTSTTRIHLPKTEAGIRTIPLLDTVKDAIYMAKEEQEELGIKSPVIDGMTGFVFLNRFGNLLNYQSVNMAIKRIVDTYNSEEEIAAAKENREPFFLPHFTCHNCRHTFATRLCERCTNLKVIQSVMGHKSIETTMDVYAEATEEKKQSEFELLAQELDNLF